MKPHPKVKAGVGISGIYDLEPIRAFLREHYTDEARERETEPVPHGRMPSMRSSV